MESGTEKGELCKAFSAYLKDKGGRFTTERAAIIHGIELCGQHFRLEDLRIFLEKENFRVSKATLYNTLNELVHAGFVSRLVVREETIYGLSYKSSFHCHQICTNCGKITEFANDGLDAMVSGLKYKRFNYSEYSLLVYGICSACKALLKREKKKNKTKTK